MISRSASTRPHRHHSAISGKAASPPASPEGYSDANESRWLSDLNGYSSLNRLLLVSFTERGRDVIRVISARLATRKERKSHEENEGK
jgi:uncharacterized DUF497 family protein